MAAACTHSLGLAPCTWQWHWHSHPFLSFPFAGIIGLGPLFLSLHSLCHSTHSTLPLCHFSLRARWLVPTTPSFLPPSFLSPLFFLTFIPSHPSLTHSLNSSNLSIDDSEPNTPVHRDHRRLRLRHPPPPGDVHSAIPSSPSTLVERDRAVLAPPRRDLPVAHTGIGHHYTQHTTIDDQRTQTNEHYIVQYPSHTLNPTPTLASQTISTIAL